MQHQRPSLGTAEVLRDRRQCIPAPDKDAAAVGGESVMRLNFQIECIARREPAGFVEDDLLESLYNNEA